MTSARHSPGPELLLVTTYDPQNQSAGGAAWVDTAVLAALDNAQLGTFFVCDDSPEGVPLEIRGSRSAQVRTLFRIMTRGEPYQAAKFRFAAGWMDRTHDLRRAADRIRSAGGKVITSQWPALLLARDAGVEVDVHIAHNVDTIIAERYDPPALRMLRNSERMRGLESDLLKHPASIVALSRADTGRIRAMGHSCEHLTLAPALDTAHAAARGTAQGRVIGFIGKMSWPPNASAFETLLEIVAKVNDRLEDREKFRVVVAGRGSEHVSTSKLVTSLGPLSDLDDFYSQIDLVVVPRTGETTGVSIKLLEAVTKGVVAVAPSDLIADAGLSSGVFAADSDEEIRDFLLGDFMPPEIQDVAKGGLSLRNFANMIGPTNGQTR